MADEPTPAVNAEEPSIEAAFADIDAGTAIATEPEPQTPESNAQPPAQAPEPGQPGAEPKPEAGEPKPGETVKPVERKEAEGQQQQFDIEKTPAGFRDYFKKQLADSNARIKQLTEQLNNRESAPDRKALALAMAERDKQIEGLRSELAASRFQTSPDFNEKYQKPFNRLWGRASTAMQSMEIIEDKDADGNITKTRPATPEDLQALFSMRSRPQALREARRLFGEDSGRVENYLQQLFEHVDDMNEALQTEKQDWEKKAQERTAERTKFEQAAGEMWVTLNKSIEEKHPEWFAEDPADKEGTELLRKGRQLVDSYFANRNKMRPQDLVLMEANIRHRTAAFPRLVRQVNLLKAELAQLKKQGAVDERQLPGGQARRQTTPASKPEGRFGEDIDDSFFDHQEIPG